MPTANEDLLAAVVRHQVDILRFSKGTAESALKLLDSADKDITVKIAARLASGRSVERLAAIQAEIAANRVLVFNRLKKSMGKTLSDLSVAEGAFEEGLLQASVPFELQTVGLNPGTLQVLAGNPIRGLPLDGWLDNMAAADISRLQQVVSIGLIEGQTIPQIMRELQPGLQTTKRNAEALARTSVNAVSNKAREAIWEANADIIDGLRWTATLDGRTSPICQSRDGEIAKVGDTPIPEGFEALTPANARPPAHFNCRSVMVAVIDGETAIGERSFVRDKRRPSKRLADFRASAKAQVGPAKWKTLSPTQRNKLVAVQRNDWAAKNIGSVPAKVTYEQWLRKQPKQFQNEVLGKTKATMFRQGASLDKFVDASGKSLTLSQLKAEGAQQLLAVQQPALGLKAKALILQGLDNDAVLEKILAEYPDASTTKASIASYKSVMKKAGLLDIQPVPGVSKTINTYGNLVQNTIEQFTNSLPPGLKNAIGNGWYKMVDDIQGPGSPLAHYIPGQGVEINFKKFYNLSQVQARQVLAHELGHMLHKQYDIDVGNVAAFKTIAKDTWTPDDFKNYSYYMSSTDEIAAELLGQVIHPSAITSQGLVANKFNAAFKGTIEYLKETVALKFPVPKPKQPAYSNGPATPGSGLVGGSPQSMGVGNYIKSLLQQQMNADDILIAVKAEFPDAKTTKASISSTKSTLKKKGLLGSPGSKVTTASVQKTPIAPVATTDIKPKVMTAQDAAQALNMLDSDGKIQFAASAAAQKSKAKKILLKLLQSGKTGPNSQLSEQISALLPQAGMKASNVASFKTQWKKKGWWGEDKMADLGMAEPKLKLSQMGSHSKAGLVQAEKLFANGATKKQVNDFFASHFGSWDPDMGADLMYLAEFNAKHNKFSGSKSAAAVAKSSYAKPSAGSIDMTPSAKAVSPVDSWPPPPRFSEEQRKAGIMKILGGQYTATTNTTVNKALKLQGKEPLTATEYSVVRAYTGSSYGMLNRKLRSGEFNDDLYLQAVVDAGQAALRKMGKSDFLYQGIVNRGTSLNPTEMAAFQKMYVKGAVIEEHAFLSTSTSSGFGGRIRFKIKSKTGVQVKVLSRHPGENEVLFMPGAKFRIDEVVTDNNARTTSVTMTEIDP